MDDYSDLIGGGDDPAPKKKLGRPSKADLAARQAAKEAEEAHQEELRLAAIGRTKLDEGDFLLPMGTNQLHRILRIDVQTIKKRLANVKPAATLGANRNVYYFHEVLPYLVKPKWTAEQFARSLNKADLPPEINKAFWDSQRSRIKYKIESQEAWETEDVLRVFGEVFMTVKETLTASIEEMRVKAKLTDEQSRMFEATIDELRDELRSKLVEMPTKSSTTSMFEKPLFGVNEDIEPVTPDFDDLDDD
jgi:hypothetical protein